jgi:hypothetical protein
MGFDCTHLKSALVRVNRKSGFSEAKKGSFLRSSVRALVSSQVEKWESNSKGVLKVFLLTYDLQDAFKEIEWAQDYWLNKREAIPTTQAAKCRVCEFNDVC